MLTGTQTHAQKQSALVAPVITNDTLKIDLKAYKLVFKAYASGVQMYECKKDTATGELKWTPPKPKATLYDDKRNKIGEHGFDAGPFWRLTLTTDTSKVTAILKDGKPKGRIAGPSAGAIPWLLLDAKGDGGYGKLGRVTLIQRVDTNGGKAPEGGCCDLTGNCKMISVPYTATYYFYAPKK